MKKILTFIVGALLCTDGVAQDIVKYPWLDTSKSFHERAVLLCKELTLREKVDQLGTM